MDDDEHKQLHSTGQASSPNSPNKKSDLPPLKTRSRYRRPYQTGCLGCLSRVPGCSLASWLIICIGCGSYVGGNLVLSRQISDFTLGPQCPIFPYFVIAVAGATAVLATKVLITNHCSSGETSRHELLTPGRNSCTRCCVGFAMVLAYIFQFIWTILFTGHVIMLLMLIVTTFCREPTLNGCIDLRHYGFRVKTNASIEPLPSVESPSGPPPPFSNVAFTINVASTTPSQPQSYVGGSNSTYNATVSYRVVGTYRNSAHICGQDLERFMERSYTYLISMVFGVGGTILVLIGMLNLIICLAGNYKHVKEIRHLPYMVAMSGSGDEYIIEKADDVHLRMLNHD